MDTLLGAAYAQSPQQQVPQGTSLAESLLHALSMLMIGNGGTFIAQPQGDRSPQFFRSAPSGCPVFAIGALDAQLLRRCTEMTKGDETHRAVLVLPVLIISFRPFKNVFLVWGAALFHKFEEVI